MVRVDIALSSADSLGAAFGGGVVRFVEFPLSDGGCVLVGVEQAEQSWSGVVTRGGSVEERLQEAACSFEAALDPIRAVGQGVLAKLSALDRPPAEVRVEFGLELSAKAGAVVSASGELFEGLFTGAVRETYRASVAVARERGAKLRVVLHLEAPELAALPWEAMWDPEAQSYLCRKEPLVRHVPAPYTPDPLPVDPPMRILCLVASPRGLPELDVELERQRLDQALDAAIADGRIHVEWLVNATWDALQDRLLTGTWHVLHFIGHGDYDPDLDQGRVALVREEDGRADWVEASRLVDLLNEANPTPRLVVLNSCSTGQSGTQDVLSGTAAALVNGGISAVAAMQFRISDPAAVAFPRGFYKALAAGKSVDAALSSGRIAILGRGESLEWVTPVLYMRGGASQLFTVQPATPQTRGTTEHPDQTHPQIKATVPPAVARPPATAPPPIATTPAAPRAVTDDPRYRRGQAAYLHGDLDEAVILFEQIHAEHPTVDIPELATARRKRELAASWVHGATDPTRTTPQSPASPSRGPIVASDGRNDVPAEGAITQFTASHRGLARVLLTVLGAMFIFLGSRLPFSAWRDLPAGDLTVGHIAGALADAGIVRTLDTEQIPADLETVASVGLVLMVLAGLVLFGLTGSSGRLTRYAAVLAAAVVVAALVGLAVLVDVVALGEDAAPDVGAWVVLCGCVLAYAGGFLARR